MIVTVIWILAVSGLFIYAISELLRAKRTEDDRPKVRTLSEEEIREALEPHARVEVSKDNGHPRE